MLFSVRPEPFVDPLLPYLCSRLSLTPFPSRSLTGRYVLVVKKMKNRAVETQPDPLNLFLSYRFFPFFVSGSQRSMQFKQITC